MDTVFEHDAWYNQYTKLRAAKKRAIEEWRTKQKTSVNEEQKIEFEVQPKSATINRDLKIKDKIEIWKVRNQYYSRTSYIQTR